VVRRVAPMQAAYTERFMAKDTQQELIPAESSDDLSTSQLTALVGSVMSGLKPMAEQQAQVQLAQIAATRDRDERAFAFARTTLFTVAAGGFLVVALLAAAAAFLLAKGNDQAALQVISFGLGAFGGFGIGRLGRTRQ